MHYNFLHIQNTDFNSERKNTLEKIFIQVTVLQKRKGWEKIPAYYFVKE